MRLFITFEGGEGAGKSTQGRALRRRLVKLGLPVVLTHEPGGSPLGNLIRRWLKYGKNITPQAELLLFAVSRAQLVTQVIQPSLERGYIVLCDRFSDSTLAYQGYGRGLALGTIEAVNAISTLGLKPVLTVLLDITPEEGLCRKRLARVGRGKRTDRFEAEEIAFHRRVREGYLAVARAEPERWLVVDGTLPRKEAEQVIWQRASSFL